MHLIDKDPVPKDYKPATTTASSAEPKKNSLGTAIKNKLRSAAGAPGRAIYNKVVKPHDDLKMDRSNKEYAFLKDYNAKAKRGIEISNVDEAKMQMFRDRK
jgi:hypothetical protein